MLVSVKWEAIAERDWRWDMRRCLYSYVDADTRDVLYVGKAEHQTVRQRMYGRHKQGIYDWFFDEYGIDDFIVLFGDLHMEEGRRFSSALLSDVESLLISELQPPANICCKRSRISRPGLHVKCFGSWRGRKTFRDHG